MSAEPFSGNKTRIHAHASGFEVRGNVYQSAWTKRNSDASVLTAICQVVVLAAANQQRVLVASSTVVQSAILAHALTKLGYVTRVVTPPVKNCVAAFADKSVQILLSSQSMAANVDSLLASVDALVLADLSKPLGAAQVTDKYKTHMRRKPKAIGRVHVILDNGGFGISSLRNFAQHLPDFSGGLPTRAKLEKLKAASSDPKVADAVAKGIATVAAGKFTSYTSRKAAAERSLALSGLTKSDSKPVIEVFENEGAVDALAAEWEVQAAALPGIAGAKSNVTMANGVTTVTITLTPVSL